MSAATCWLATDQVKIAASVAACNVPGERTSIPTSSARIQIRKLAAPNMVRTLRSRRRGWRGAVEFVQHRAGLQSDGL